MSKPVSQTREYNAAKVRAYRARQKARRAEEAAALAAKASQGNQEKLERLAGLIQQARLLAEEINGEIVADLKAQPLSREAAALLDAYEGREMRIPMAKVDLPV